MKILFTGSSSFTGYWFIKELIAAGHSVVATFRRGAGDYADQRARRVAAVRAMTPGVFDCRFGDARFMDVLGDPAGFDLFCHHAAEARDHRSQDFDVLGALAGNTRNLVPVLRALNRSGCSRLVFTGSVFEPGAGAGSRPAHAVTRYGLSKGLTSSYIGHFARAEGVCAGKFTIANPFGPLEEMRFTSGLAWAWYQARPARVETPAYVRDNIPVSLLAKAYVRFAESLDGRPGLRRANPSGYVESQGAFAGRLAAAMAPRLGLACDLELAAQTDFPEPPVRINTEPLDWAALDWNEDLAWDQLAAYYREAFGGTAPGAVPG